MHTNNSRTLKLLLCAGIFLLSLSPLVLPQTVRAAVVTYPAGDRQCDANAVIYCGAYNSREVIAAYMNPADASVRNIYNGMGITNQDIAEFEARAVRGSVTKQGKIMLGDQVIAVNGVTAGRQNVFGSVALKYNGTTYYKRSTNEAFNDSLEYAYVVRDSNKNFKYAILVSNGDPVIGAPINPHKSFNSVASSVANGSYKPQPHYQSQNNVTTYPPKVESTTTTSTSTANYSKAAGTYDDDLPHTGPGNMIVLFFATVVAAYGTRQFLRQTYSKT